MSLDSLDAGDKVFIQYFSFSRNCEIKTIERTTKTQIIVGGRRYNRRTGYVVGGDVYSSPIISEVTDEKIALYNEQQRTKRIKNLLESISSIKPSEMSDEMIELANKITELKELNNEN